MREELKGTNTERPLSRQASSAPSPPPTPPSVNSVSKEPLQRGSTGEFIAADAPHWKREAFIPVATEDLGLELARRQGIQEEEFRRGVARIYRLLTRTDQIRRRKLARLFAPLDPDREVVRIDAEKPDAIQRDRLVQAIDDVLDRAAYTRLTEEDVRSSVAVSSAWGVKVFVDFDQLGRWAVYARGDVSGVRPRRQWKKLWRSELTEVPLYQRMVVLFELAPHAKVMGEILADDRLHLRLFKNIPKPDVDMLLPYTKPKLGWFDQTKIFLPTIGNVGMTIFKIARGLLLVAFVGFYGTLALLALIVGACVYSVRSVFVYLQTKDRLLLNMTRSLYFQKLDSGGGVLWNLCQSALEQEIEEAMVAAAALMEAKEPLSESDLTKRAAAIVQDIAQVEVLFRTSRALETLRRVQLVATDAAGKFVWLSPVQKGAHGRKHS